MKTPKAVKLPSGKYRCRVRVNGEDISVTRETEKDAVAEAMAISAGIINAPSAKNGRITLSDAIDEYIELRKPSLSPSTIRGYRIIQKNRLQGIMHLNLKKVTDDDIQRALNVDARHYGAKTMKNTWGFISSVLSDRAGRHVNASVPTVVKNERPFIDPEDLPRYLEAIHGHKHEIPLLLALHGLRVSEILALRRSSIDTKKRIIHVRGAAVPDEDNKLVEKAANKTSSSRRDVPIMIPRLIEALEESGLKKDDPICRVKTSGTIYNASARVCKSIGIPETGTHGLRHTFASICYDNGVPEAVTAQWGGWSDFATIRNIYTHLARRTVSEYADSAWDFFSEQEKKTEKHG